MKYLALIFLLLFIFVITNCGTDAGADSSLPSQASKPYNNQIFSGTLLISATAITPTSSSPYFNWQSSKPFNTVVSIFTHPIVVYSNDIVNKQDAIWIWTSGFGSGREGDVSYTDGAPVQNEVILQQTPSPLSSGTYYWAIWTHDEYYNLKGSSIEYKQVVN